MKKLKRYATQLGCGIATLLMFTPLVVIAKNDLFSTGEFFFLLIASILYDMYMYQVILSNDTIEKAKEHYYNYVKDADKKLHLNSTYKEKYEGLQNYIEDFFDKNTKN